jgi:hypothetical protein
LTLALDGGEWSASGRQADVFLVGIFVLFNYANSFKGNKNQAHLQVTQNTQIHIILRNVLTYSMLQDII